MTDEENARAPSEEIPKDALIKPAADSAEANDALPDERDDFEGEVPPIEPDTFSDKDLPPVEMADFDKEETLNEDELSDALPDEKDNFDGEVPEAEPDNFGKEELPPVEMADFDAVETEDANLDEPEDVLPDEAQEVPAEKPEEEAAAPPEEESADSEEMTAVPPPESQEEPDGPKAAAPEVPPKKSRTGVWIGVIIAVIAAAVIGGLLYMKFFIPSQIYVSESTLDLYVGDTARLTYTIEPASADNLQVGWASSNEEVAAVDEFGVVTAISGGQCAIAVATGNGKTDTCVVTVTDPAQIQKESLNDIRTSISEKATEKEGEISLVSAEEIDDTHHFMIGSDDTDIYLIYRSVGKMDEFGVDAQYSTCVKLSPLNIETAEVIQDNVLNIYGFPVSMTGTGSMNISTYQHGDKVPLNTTSSSVQGLDATEALHELTDNGSTICLDMFAKYLAENNFGFTLEEFGFTNYKALETVPETKAVEEAVISPEAAQESWDSIADSDILSQAESTAAVESEAAVSEAAEAVESETVVSEATEAAESVAAAESEAAVSEAAEAVESTASAESEAAVSATPEAEESAEVAAAASETTEAAESTAAAESKTTASETPKAEESTEAVESAASSVTEAAEAVEGAKAAESTKAVVITPFPTAGPGFNFDIGA